MVQTTRNFERFDQKKKEKKRQSVDAILEDVNVAETI